MSNIRKRTYTELIDNAKDITYVVDSREVKSILEHPSSSALKVGRSLDDIQPENFNKDDWDRLCIYLFSHPELIASYSPRPASNALPPRLPPSMHAPVQSVPFSSGTQDEYDILASLLLTPSTSSLPPMSVPVQLAPALPRPASNPPPSPISTPSDRFAGMPSSLPLSPLTFFSPAPTSAPVSLSESKRPPSIVNKKKRKDDIQYLGRYNKKSDKAQYYVILKKNNIAMYVRELKEGEKKYKDYTKARGALCSYTTSEKGLTVLSYFQCKNDLKKSARKRKLKIIDSATNQELFASENSEYSRTYQVQKK